MTTPTTRSKGRGVSEVIGVILMVGITIVVAALVGGFVFGLDNNPSPGPATTVTITYDDVTDKLTMQHETGDQIFPDELQIRGDCGGCNQTVDQAWADYSNASASGSIDGKSAVASGDTLTLTSVGSAYDIYVVWQPEKGDVSTTLASAEGPDA